MPRQVRPPINLRPQLAGYESIIRACWAADAASPLIEEVVGQLRTQQLEISRLDGAAARVLNQ